MEVVFYSASCHALDEHWSGVITGPRRPAMDEIKYIISRDERLPPDAITVNSISHTSFPVTIK